MTDLTSVIQIMTYALMGAAVIGAIGAVTFRSLFHAALSFTGVLLGIAGIYLTLHAEFLAVIQVLIYVGAVMTIVIFAIMLTERFGDSSIVQNNRQNLLGLVGGIALIIFLGKLIMNTGWVSRKEILESSVSVADIGTALLTTHVFPFEVIAVVLTAILIGAVIIAKKDKE